MYHIMVVNDSNVVPKKSPKYYCNKCDFVCSKKSNWDRHIITRKHVNGSNMVVNGSNLVPKSAIFTCVCGKTYKWESGYYRHKKLCSSIQEENSTNITISGSIQQDKTDVTQKLVELIMSKNQDFMTELVTNLTHSNKDVVNKMMEIMPTM